MDYDSYKGNSDGYDWFEDDTGSDEGVSGLEDDNEESIYQDS